MKRHLLYSLIIGGINALAGSAQAETIWLVYAVRHNTSAHVIDKIAVESFEQCQAEGSKMKADKSFRITMFDNITFTCVKGK